MNTPSEKKGMLEREERIKCITQGMESYFRTFSLAHNMYVHSGDIEWITPRTGYTGPSVVFRVALDERTAQSRIEGMLTDLKARTIPSLWVISPTSTPANLIDLLRSVGFVGGSEPEHPEPGMALDLATFSVKPEPRASIRIAKVDSLAEFSQWIDVVNTALHGWDMLSAEHYAAWLYDHIYEFYLGYDNGTPVATYATLQTGETASIEFVSTLMPYRHRGTATALGVRALRDLQQKGVRTVTLHAFSEAISLYERLGFKSYYQLAVLSFPRI